VNHEPPAGVPPVPWLLHQAALALSRDQAGAALDLVCRALGHDPTLTEVGERAEVVRAALPELVRLAKAQALAAVVRLDEAQPPVNAGVLAGFVDLLDADPQGQALLATALEGNVVGAREALLQLARREELSPVLAQHLALVFLRTALSLEGRGLEQAAQALWRRAWDGWMRFLSSLPGEDPGRSILLDHLLGLHRRRVNDLLVRGDVTAARRHWDLVLGLPTRAPDLAGAVRRFRDELATEYLVLTRQAMRYGAIREGWRADYEKGLGYLRRFLSLDRENVRLLTALAEVCGEWFLDCYNNEAREELLAQVERFTPFALQLARLVGEAEGHLPGRLALAEFYKFRGFVAAGRRRKMELYREALRFNPGHENVQQLLAELE
jgi:hypothetical protein